MTDKPIVHGTADNIERAGYIHAPEKIAHLIRSVLLSTPDRDYLVGDLTGAGIGHLLAPFACDPHARIIGVELARDRAEELRRRIPHATVYPNDCLSVRFSPNSFSVLVTNPPYLTQDGQDLELHMLRHVLPFLTENGILVTILPMRSTWNAHMVEALAKHCYALRAFKFPDEPGEADFGKYTQAVIIGKKRSEALTHADPSLVKEMLGWRYDTRRMKKGLNPWIGGKPLPEIPEGPGPHTYPVPPMSTMPDVTILRPTEALVRVALGASGVHKSDQWCAATRYDLQQQRVPAPLMPLIGKTHLAALILIGLLDGQTVTGPDGHDYIFSSFISTRWQENALEENERLKHVIRKRSMQDLPILGVLNCTTGDTTYYTGSGAYTFLEPWLPTLSRLVAVSHRPRYTLSDARDWMIRVVLSIGTDKRLRGAEHAGLSPAQMHRVFAHWTALVVQGKDAFAGTPGVGKTRMLLALMALLSYYWHHRDDPSFEENLMHRARPRWVKGIRSDWSACRWTQGDAPKALPLAVVVPPRTVKTWQEEAVAWPEVKVIVIESHRDVRRWMDLCAAGSCVEPDASGKLIEHTFPAVIAVFKQSTTRPNLLSWKPSVIENPRGFREIADLDAPGDAVLDEETGRLVGKRHPDTGAILTKAIPISHFFCPECKQLVTAVPRSLAASVEQPDIDELLADELEAEEHRPVEHIAWFYEQPRWCTNVRPQKERRGTTRSRTSEQVCGSPLWTWCRVADTKEKPLQIPFAEWAQGTEARLAGGILPVQEGDERKESRAEATGKPCASTRDAGKGKGKRIANASGELGPALADSFSPFDYYAHYYRNCAAFTAVDEAHNLSGLNTNVGRAGHRIMRASQTRTIASGTPYPGDLGRFFFSWYRFAPEFWRGLGIGYKEVTKAIREYGLVEQVIRARVVTKKGTPETELSATTKSAPGISTRLLPLLLAYYIYIDVLDVGEHMPKRREIPVVVEMDDVELERARSECREKLDQANKDLTEAQANYDRIKRIGLEESPALDIADIVQSEAIGRVQEAEEERSHLDGCDLALAYRQTVNGLREVALAGNSTAQMMLGLLPGWMSTHPFDPAYTISRTHRGEWGEEEGHEIVFRSPTLSWDYVYPLERECQKIVASEIAEAANEADPPRSRRVMVYYHQSRKRDVGKRLAWILRDFSPWVLPDSIPPQDREGAIKRAVAEGHTVLVVPYLKVCEGLNLQVIDTVIWYEMSQNMIRLEQASQRCWRLGKNEEVRIYFLVYKGSVSHEKLIRLAQDSGAASLFMGDSPEGGLAALVGADQLTLAQVARRLTSGEELRAAFERRDSERETVLKRGRSWIGIEVDPLPPRIEGIRRELEAEKATWRAKAESGAERALHGELTPKLRAKADRVRVRTTREKGKETRQKSREANQAEVLPGFPQAY